MEGPITAAVGGGQGREAGNGTYNGFFVEARGVFWEGKGGAAKSRTMLGVYLHKILENLI